MKRLLIIMMAALVSSCTPMRKDQLIIFHAGSLSLPLQHISEAFQRKYPDVEILREASGSVAAARKVTELGKTADIVASADYAVIREMLMPAHADFNVKFATNEMVIMYRPESRYAAEITTGNWPEILLRPGVQLGHSDPDTDPCGYRSQFVMQLAEDSYRRPGLYEALRRKIPSRNIRPKEVDLLALLEAGELDYIFIYRSVAEQHRGAFVVLPDEINLKSPALADHYRRARVEVAGASPGERMIRYGEPMIYGITILKGAPHDQRAVQFLTFLLGPEGQAIMIQDLHPIVPPQGDGAVPPQLKTVVTSR